MSKNRKLFLTDYCLTPYDNIPASGILCENEKIIGTGGASAYSLDEPGLEVIKLDHAYAVPGFIDSHIHSVLDSDAADHLPTQEDLSQMSQTLIRHGVTTFFPTLTSRPRGQMLQNIDTWASLLEKGCPAAEAPGLHVEGPFINKEKRGSQQLDGICEIDLGYAQEMIQAGRGKIKVMTFAPELPGAEDLIQLMLENGIIPSMGHSLADEEQTLRSIEAGARRCTYVFNGMPILHHRSSTLTTVALTDDRVSVEIIVDGAHIHPRMVDLASRAKPRGKLIGISNALLPTGGNDDGASSSLKITDKLITNTDGVIAGANMTLENSWLQLMNYSKMPQTFAAACFTSNPAIDLGLITRGELKPGRRADITFFDTETNKVRMTVLRGKIIYQAQESQPNS